MDVDLKYVEQHTQFFILVLVGILLIRDQKDNRTVPTGTRTYSIDEATEIYKPSPIRMYIGRRIQIVLLAYVMKRPIYKLCREAVRSAETPTRT